MVIGVCVLLIFVCLFAEYGVAVIFEKNPYKSMKGALAIVKSVLGKRTEHQSDVYSRTHEMRACPVL